MIYGITQQMHGATVMVADDNAENRALAKATLEDEGCRIVLANDGQAAIAAAAAQLPACIIMDVRMPGIDGIEACRRIREMPHGHDVAIIFVTAHRDVETFDRALAAGGDDFITKPFRPDELIVRVQTALRLRKIASERAELYAQLKHQRDELQRLELQKEQLVAFLVHDLKNPVNAIELHAQAVQRTSDAERARRAASGILDETRSLLAMITNLLDISKADEGRLSPVISAIDAVTFVHEVLDRLALRAAAAKVRIATEITATEVRADPDLLGRVLANLIDNAIRHAPEGSEIQVSVARANDGLELRVADAGPGVPLPDRERVFERFESGSPTATRTNRGLGLAFCKLAVEAHRGRIWIEDAAPGAVFCVRIAQ